jgi:hypothetical protein
VSFDRADSVAMEPASGHVEDSNQAAAEEAEDSESLYAGDSRAGR